MKDLICIVCPKGCHLRVDEQNDYQVSGNACPRGAEYGRNEMLHPVRVLTSIVKVTGGTHRCCSVKTSGGIPKEDIGQAMELLKTIELQSPVHIGQIVVNNVCSTGVNWIATKNV